MTDLNQARRLLEQEGHTCVLYRAGTAHTTRARGVRPLVKWLTQGMDLTGFSAADKVVGMATAYLYCLLHVRAVHAQVMSRPAARVLAENGIEAHWDILAENIINRTGTGICPFEAAVRDCTTAEEALTAIREKMREMNISI